MYKAVAEEHRWLPAQFSEEAPKASTAYFSLSTGQPCDLSLWMLIGGMSHLPCDLQPIAHRVHLSKGDLRTETK